MLEQITALRPAARTQSLGFSEIVKIRNRVLELRQQGTPVLQLEGGEPFPPTPEFIKAAMRDALARDLTRYAPSSGVPLLLDAIRAKLAEKNRLEIEPRNLIVTHGGAHALFCAFQATLDPGSEALFFSPYWTPIRDQVRFCGATPVLIPWSEVHERGAAEAIERRISPTARLLYLNTPSNPGGEMLDRDQLDQISTVAREHNLIVISDEAYEDLVYEGEHLSIASLPGMLERTISVFTLSKSFSMTGWRCGYLVAAELFMEPIRKLVLNSINGVSTPTQYAAAAAIADRSDYLANLRDEYRSRRDLLIRGVRDAGFRCATPRGAFYLFADVRARLGGDSWKAMDRLLDETGIATVPGVVFGPEGEGFLRMSFSNPIETLERAVEALGKLG